jgi:hypothetical protein
VKELSAQVLGTSHAHYADRLTEATRDCPLVTVIGGRLLVEKAVAPELLERHGEFQQAALSKFQDEIVGKVGDQVDPPLCRSLLNLMAAIMPTGPLGGSIGTAAAEFLNTNQATLVRAIDQLEIAGVVYSRGSSIRITPDVLADHILHNACLTSSGQRTGFVSEIFDRFGSLCMAHLLRNLGELDWRINRTSPTKPVDLLATVWGNITEAFATADAEVRSRFLDVLTDFSYFQPRRILDLCEFTMRNPSDEPEAEDHVFRIRHRHVLAKLPKLLRRVGYSLECLPRACELLWELGRDDDRPLRHNPDEAMGVLADFATYSVDKPANYNKAVVECIASWITSADSSKYLGKLCELIDLLLEKTGHTSHIEGEIFSLRPFLVSEPNTRRVRHTAISLLEELLFSDNPKAVIRAVKGFRKALHDPMPIGNPQVSSEFCAVWEDEQLRVLEILNRVIGRHKFAIATLRVLGAIRLATRLNGNPKVRARAREICETIAPDFQLQLTELLIGDYQHLVEDEDYDGDVKTSLEKQGARLKNRSLMVSEHLVRAYANPRDGFNVLSDCLDLILLDEHPGPPVTFLTTIGETNLEYAHGLCEAALQSPGRSLAAYFAFLIAPIRRLAPRRGFALLSQALASQSPVLWRGVASFYFYPAWSDWALDEDVPIIESLVGHSDPQVRTLSVSAVQNLGKVRPDIAKKLALSIEIVGSNQLPQEFFLRLGVGTGITLAEYNEEEIDVLVGKLANVGSLEDYWINQFLVFASRRRPLSVIRMLLDRVETAEWDVIINIRPLPTLGFDLQLDGLPQHPEYPSMVREVRDRSLGPAFRGKDVLFPQLFREITLDFTTDFVPILNEWLESKDESKIKAVGSLVKESPPDLIFTYSDFIGRLLGSAHDIGEACFETVSDTLKCSSITQVKYGNVGQPFPEDFALRDRASAMAKASQPGSPQWRFYDSLAQYAESLINANLL